MSHGAAGFGYVLSELAAVTGQAEFADAAAECFAFTSGHLRDEMHPRSQWCHGAVGVGLARLALAKFGSVPVATVADDVNAALRGAALIWPGHVDTLCCGSLGAVELLAEAGTVLRRAELTQSGSRRSQRRPEYEDVRRRLPLEHRKRPVRFLVFSVAPPELGTPFCVA